MDNRQPVDSLDHDGILCREKRSHQMTLISRHEKEKNREKNKTTQQQQQQRNKKAN